METVLSAVITSPGVMGGLIMDDAGKVLVQSLPAMFDKDQVAGAVTVLAEQQIGLEEGTGGVRTGELRFELGKLIVRPVADRSIVLICEHAANLQMLMIALNVASKKLEKLPMQQPVVPVVAAAVQEPVKPVTKSPYDDIPAAYRSAMVRR